MATQPVAIFVVLATACLVTVLLIPSWTYGARAPQASGASVVTPEVAAARRAGVREEVWESGATSLPLDLCDPGAAARLARTFTLEARRGLPGAFVVRILGSGGAELPEVSLTLDINSSQRSDAKTFQLRPLLVAAGGGNVGVLEIEDASAGTWTATSTVSAVPPAWCDRGGLPGTVQLAALQPWGGVSSAEFSWDGRACAVLIFVWVAVRALATDPAEIPLAFACDAYCLAYSCGLAVRAALEARVKSSFVVQLASAARACALGGDLLLLLGLVLRALRPSSAPARPQKWPSSRRSPPRAPPAPLPQIPEDAVLAVDSAPACWAPCLALAAVAAAALAPALHAGAPPGFFLCADGEDPLSAPGSPPAALRLAPLVLAAPAALLVARGGSPGGGQCASAALAFAGAPAAAWALARLCTPQARRRLQLLAALGAMRTGGAAALVAGGCQWCRRVPRPRLVYVCAVAVFLIIVCEQVEEMAAAGPGPWLPAASSSGSSPLCSPHCAVPCAGGAGVDAPQPAAPQLVPSPPAPPQRLGTRAVVCVADAQEPLRFRVELGEACGDKGWTQRLSFAALLSPEPGTQPVCLAYAASPARFLLKQGATCGGSGWKQSSVLYLHSSQGQGREPLCFAEAAGPLRSKVVPGVACGDNRWTQRFVVYADALAARPQGAPEAAAKAPAELLGLLRAARREADSLQALLAEVPSEQHRSHPLWHASVLARRAYFTSAYAAQVDPGGAKEAGANHAWDAETVARQRLHCEGWVRDRTDTHRCAGPGGTAVSRPVGSSCGAGPKRQAPAPFLRPGRMEEEGPKLCTGMPAVGQLQKDECAEAQKLASELVGRTHGAAGRANQAELPFEGCPTCAVVGSSGNLLGQGLGSDIDAHDVVIRINCAPTLGFGADVGSRTTHRFFYPEASWFAEPQDEPCAQLADLGAEGSSLLAVLFKPKDIDWWHAMVSGGAPPKTGFWHPVPAKMGLPAARVAVVSVSWLNHATAGLVSLERSLGVDVQKDKWPSTGFFGMLLAMQLCRTVDIYGFGRRLRNGSQLDPSMIKYYM